MHVTLNTTLPLVEGSDESMANAVVPVCTVDELPVGLGRAFQVGDVTLAVFRTRKGKIFATDNRCPHKGGPLADGMLAGENVVCPLHAFRYDLHTGHCDQEGACPLKTYPLEVRGGQVVVNLGDLVP